jgi:hypothetical protein
MFTSSVSSPQEVGYEIDYCFIRVLLKRHLAFQWSQANDA